MKETLKKYRLEIVTLIIVLVVVIPLILYLYISSPEDTRNRMNEEIVKTLLSGAIIGVIALLVKQLFEASARTRVTNEQDIKDKAKKKDLLFKNIRNQLNAFNQSLDNTEVVKAFHVRQEIDEYIRYLVDWNKMEEKALASKAKKAAKDLLNEAENEGQTESLPQPVRDKFSKQVKEWAAYFNERYRGVDSKNCTIPSTWQ